MSSNPLDTRGIDPVAPRKDLVSYPTPNIADKIVNERVNAWAANYAPLEYGTKYNDVEHGPYNKSYPDHVLVFQAPDDAAGEWVRRIWASNRVDQDTYNYSISYAEGDPEFPIYTHTYVFPRATYEPLPPLSEDPDPAHAGAYLTQEQMINEVEPAELGSLYVKVVRVYETLPGPVTTTYDYDTELNINVRTRRQVVISFQTPLTDPPVDNVPTETPLTLDLRETPRTKYTKLRIISDLLELPATKTEYQTGRYPFPALVTDITVSVYSLDPVPDRSETIWFPTMRSEPNVPALFQVETSFYDAPPGDPSGPPVSTLYVINPQNLIYRGISYQIAINNVLNDAISVSASFTGDAVYGDLNEPFSWPASVPSAAQYTALIGTYQIVGCDITRWRGNIWVRQQQSLLLV